MKKLPTIQEIYRGLRKPVAQPTRVERDRRDEIRRREDRKSMEDGRGARRGSEKEE